MATYIPNATQITEPTEDRPVESAALEFRTLKEYAVGIVDSAAAAAAASADEAEAAAAAAAQTADVVAWEGSTYYSVGATVWDTTNFLTYRRKTAGYSPTRPGLDPTNWQLLTMPIESSFAGLRNLIINGNFAINQRGWVSGTGTISVPYTLDRWKLNGTPGNITFISAGNGRIVTVVSGSLLQTIEGASIAGGTYVLNWTGTATCQVNGIARAKGATFFLIAAANATVVFSGGTIGDVQLEPGTVVTPFESRPIGLELMLCQRFFRNGVQATSGYSAGVASGNIAAWHPFDQPMRAAPTVSADSSIQSSGVSATSVDSALTSGFRVVLSSSTSGPIFSVGNYTASAEL